MLHTKFQAFDPGDSGDVFEYYPLYIYQTQNPQDHQAMPQTTFEAAVP